MKSQPQIFALSCWQTRVCTGICAGADSIFFQIVSNVITVRRSEVMLKCTKIAWKDGMISTVMVPVWRKQKQKLQHLVWLTAIWCLGNQVSKIFRMEMRQRRWVWVCQSVLWLRARVAGGGDEGDACSSSLVRRQERDRRREWQGPFVTTWVLERLLRIWQWPSVGMFALDKMWLKSACAHTDADVLAQPVSAARS